MDYRTLTQDEKDDMIVWFLKGQEIDYFLHSINMERYKAISNDEGVEDKEFQKKCKTSSGEEYKAMLTTARIIKHTLLQIPDEKRIVKAIKRLSVLSKK